MGTTILFSQPIRLTELTVCLTRILSATNSSILSGLSARFTRRSFGGRASDLSFELRGPRDVSVVLPRGTELMTLHWTLFIISSHPHQKLF